VDDQCWSDRYHPIPISTETEALEGRLRYGLAHGVKEDLVERVAHWEGFHCAQALADGVPLHGIWIDRSKLYEARRRGKTLAREDYVTDFLKLAPLPCWSGLTTAERRRKVQEMIADGEAEAAVRRQASGKSVLGMATVQAQSPLDRPASKLNKSRRPLIHAASKVVRETYKVVRRAFVEAYHEASKELLRGGRNVVFPRWSFPPGLPFDRSGPIFEPFWDGCVERLLPAEAPS
jgi:hypothetical protein